MTQICISQLQTHIPQILLNSGRYFMRTGNYIDCINTPGMDYNAVYFNQAGNVAALYASLCLPLSCTSQIITHTIDELAEQHNSSLRVSFILNHLNEQKPGYDWLFFFTIILISLLTFLVIISTLSQKASQNKILSSFTLKNTLKIFKYNPDSRLNVLNGIRSISMFWVIFGHQYSLVIVNTSNIISINDRLYQWKQLIIQAGILAVDIFFFVGGFLVAYSVLKQDKIKSNFKYPLALLNRYLRFLPSYFLAILLYYSIMPHLIQGPYAYQNAPANNCNKIWKPLLFIDNLVDNGNSMCMGWGWYLQNDMQIFIYSLVILVVYGKSKFWAYMAILVSVILSFGWTMGQTYNNSYKYTTHLGDFDTFGDYMANVYIKPWGRCPTYLFGLLLGILYVEFLRVEKKIETEHNKVVVNEKNLLLSAKKYFISNPWKRRIFELLGLLICTTIILIPRTAQGDNHKWSQLSHSLFLTYSKLIFVIGIAIIILPSLLGTNSIVRFTMDTKIFNLIAKISFWTYLIHLTIMYRWIFSMQIDFYYSFQPLFILFISTTVQSMIFGFFFCVIVEIPFSRIQKLFMNYLSKEIQKKKNQRRRIQARKIEENSMDQLENPIVLNSSEIK